MRGAPSDTVPLPEVNLIILTVYPLERLAVVEGRMIPPSSLTGEGTQLYFRKRRAWADSQTPISGALARALAAASRLGLRPRPTRRLRRGRIPAPQNDICFAPAIRVSLNDSFRP